MSSHSTFTDVLAKIQEQIIFYVYPLWMIFGIIGCLLNLVIFSRPRLRKTSCSIYFFAASVDHLMTLIIGISPVLYSLNNPDPMIEYLWFCKLRGYLFQICLMLSRWYVAFACIDRYALSSDQARLRNLVTQQNTWRVIGGVIVFWSIICSHRLIFFEIKGRLCAVVNNLAAAMYHSLYVIIGGGVLPALIMIICACLIRKNLTRKRMRRTQLSTAERKKIALDNQVHNLLFIQVAFYIIFTMPQLCNLVFNAVSITISNRSNDHIAIERFVNFLAELMLYLFPVTSFYLYTLTSRTFRTELKKAVRTIFGYPVRISPVSDGSVTLTQRF